MSEAIPRLDAAQLAARLAAREAPWQAGYYAFYTSVSGGIVTDPALMTVPADDHLVHRGDGVFETMKCAAGALYALDAHLARLRASAGRIGLAARWSDGELQHIVVETVRAGGRAEALVRMILSRGPGSYGVNPYDCPEPQLYVAVYRAAPPFMETHPEGARAATCTVPLKPSFFATIKTCNYLPNALMKMEAADAGAHFPLAFDERGFLAEGATENAGVVTPAGALLLPKRDRILDGVTMRRAEALAGADPAACGLTAVSRADVARDAVEGAAELLIFGTTPDVTAVVELDGRPVGDGRPGPVQAALNRMLRDDILRNAALRTPVIRPS